MKDDGVSAVLGSMLMLALMMSMLPAAIQLSNENKALAEARADETRAEREAAETAAWCTRHPTYTGTECDHLERLPPGYKCTMIANMPYSCTRVLAPNRM